MKTIWWLLLEDSSRGVNWSKGECLNYTFLKEDYTMKAQLLNLFYREGYLKFLKNLKLELLSLRFVFMMSFFNFQKSERGDKDSDGGKTTLKSKKKLHTCILIVLLIYEVGMYLYTISNLLLQVTDF